MVSLKVVSISDTVDGHAGHFSFKGFVDEFLEFFGAVACVAGPATEGNALSGTLNFKGGAALRALSVCVGLIEHFRCFLYIRVGGLAPWGEGPPGLAVRGSGHAHGGAFT